MVETAGNKIDKVAEKRMQQAITQVEGIASLITGKATEKLYYNPFCLLGKFGKRKYNQLLRKVKK